MFRLSSCYPVEVAIGSIGIPSQGSQGFLYNGLYQAKAKAKSHTDVTSSATWATQNLRKTTYTPENKHGTHK